MRSLFIIGDSISIQYGPFLKKLVEPRFHYDRKRGEEQALSNLDNPVGANGGDSGMVLAYLQEERVKGTRYDILLVNCGLHDIKTDPLTGAKQVNINQYITNIVQIVSCAKEIANVMIWVRTTDAIEDIHNKPNSSFLRFHEDVESYNAAADQIMVDHGIEVLDLYSFTRSFGSSVYCDHVHFTEEVRSLQAAYMAGFLEKYK